MKLETMLSRKSGPTENKYSQPRSKLTLKQAMQVSRILQGLVIGHNTTHSTPEKHHLLLHGNINSFAAN